MKSPLGLSSYGSNSVLPVVLRDVYGLGSIIPRNHSRVFDNFIDPPCNTKISDDYTNNFQTFFDGQVAVGGRRDSATLSSIWVAGGAESWARERGGVKHILWTSASPVSIVGPDLVSPVYESQYNGSSVVSGETGYIKTNPYYTYTDKTKANPWNILKTEQTVSIYYSTDYYASSLSTSSSTPIGGALELFNQTAGNGTGYSAAGENRVSFMYRYNLDESWTGALAAWYPPVILSADSGHTRCVADSIGCETAWSGMYGSSTGGVVSANVHCVSGEMYTYADAQGGYVNRNGPGSECYDTSNSGFGPSGNFYRISMSLMDVPEEVVDFDNGTLKNGAIQVRHYPLLSSLSYISNGDTSGVLSSHNVTPREKAYLSNFQFEYDVSASPNQDIHGERSYFITSSQYFVQIPYSYSTSLNQNTINVRLLLQNPSGYSGVDNPYMSGYKILDPPLQKNEEFSYIIDWELSVVDIDNI